MNIIYVEDNMGLLTRLSVGCDEEAKSIAEYIESLNFVENVVLTEMEKEDVIEMLSERRDTEQMRVQLLLKSYYSHH